MLRKVPMRGERRRVPRVGHVARPGREHRELHDRFTQPHAAMKPSFRPRKAAGVEDAVRPTAVYVPAAVKEAWKTRSQREKKSYGEIVEDAFAEHTPETLVRLFAPKPVESSTGGMPRRARPKVATGGVEVRPHLVVAQTEWIDQQVASSPLIPSRSALIAAVVEAYVTR